MALFNGSVLPEDLSGLVDREGFDGVAVAGHRGGTEHRVVDSLFGGFDGGEE